MSLTAILPFALPVLAAVFASLAVQALVRRRVPQIVRGPVLAALTVVGAAGLLVVAKLHPLPIPHGTEVEFVLLVVALVLPPLPSAGRRSSTAGTVLVASADL